MTGFRTWGLGALLLSVVVVTGCKTKPPRSPRIIDSHRPQGAMQAPPINSTTPIEVPTGPVATPVPAVPVVPVQPSFAVPAQPVQPVVPAQQVVPGVQAVPGAVPVQPGPAMVPAQPGTTGAVPVQPVVPGVQAQAIPGGVAVQQGVTGAAVASQQAVPNASTQQPVPQRLQTPVPEIVDEINKEAKKAKDSFEPERLPNLKELEEEENRK